MTTAVSDGRTIPSVKETAESYRLLWNSRRELVQIQDRISHLQNHLGIDMEVFQWKNGKIFQ